MKKVNDENRLTVRCPHLVDEWDAEKNSPYTPNDFSFASNVVVWWKCQKGHSWLARIENRSYGEGCPWCLGNHPYTGSFIWIPVM